jgi:hypothetical protein
MWLLAAGFIPAVGLVWWAVFLPGGEPNAD